MKINKLMFGALRKHSEHPRIVFIDTNDERLELGRDALHPVPLVEAERLLKRYEHDRIGRTLPPAYVITTYESEKHHLDATDLPSRRLIWDFYQDDLHPGMNALPQQVEVLQRHATIFDLLQSMQKHRYIPATIDGEANANSGKPSVSGRGNNTPKAN